MKLQQAFVSETGSQYGNFTIIGYSAPGKNSATTNFTYTNPGTYTNNTAALSGSAAAAWTATPNVKLNDCASGSGSHWDVKVMKASSGSAADAVEFSASVTGSGCEELTPSFSKIGS
ncbi:hypothetical protein [Fibrobacter sp. UWH4]|uniref:hypothetical protein n=1 Tax=Fibrobacter sp. UWH4 TaxID=1896210 RepID=UPI000923E0BD|nr:hypothetical protein [Fibrobacter sp. UWH4]SHL62345.1 hypothetical protein SAMN05720762_10951 [Fibrobacter sp. UWH4]